MKLSSEEKLLTRCAAIGSPQDAAELDSLFSSRSYSWDRAMNLAHWHRMTGTLFALLRDSANEGSVPEERMEHLKGHYRHSAVRNFFIRAEFGKIVRALQAENIEVMALKGVALIGSMYPDPGARDMADIDLLVSEESAHRAQAIVMGMNYAPVGTEAVQKRTEEVHRHLPKLLHSDGRLAVEIHTHLVSRESPLRFDIESIWKHARTEELHGVEVLVPAPEHMLMHVSVHFFLDRRFTSQSSLRQVGDIAAIINFKERPIDWDLFLQEVQLHGLGEPVFCVLSVVSTLMDVAVPEKVLDTLRPDGYSSKMEELFIRQRIMRPSTLTATELVPHQSAYTLRALIKSVFRRIRPDNQYLESHYGEEAIASPSRTRFKRLGEAAKRVMEYASNPFRLWQEVKVDRWLHTMSSNSGGTVIDGNQKAGLHERSQEQGHSHL